MSRSKEQQRHEHIEHVSHGGELNGFKLVNRSVWAARLDCYQTNFDPASALLAEQAQLMQCL
jgi:hypothetical protein